MFKIPDFSLAPPLCKQASLDLVSARKDFDPRTLVSGNLRHFDKTVRCAAHYAGATLSTSRTKKCTGQEATLEKNLNFCKTQVAQWRLWLDSVGSVGEQLEDAAGAWARQLNVV